MVCVDEAYIRKLACEATEMHSLGVKLPVSLVSTAPKKFQETAPNSKMSKNKKKKLKKKAKRQNELLKKQMEQIEEMEERDKLVDNSTTTTTTAKENGDSQMDETSSKDQESTVNADNIEDYDYYDDDEEESAEENEKDNSSRDNNKETTTTSSEEHQPPASGDLPMESTQSEVVDNLAGGEKMSEGSASPTSKNSENSNNISLNEIEKCCGEGALPSSTTDTEMSPVSPLSKDTSTDPLATNLKFRNEGTNHSINNN